jgi:hypothetical protein
MSSDSGADGHAAIARGVLPRAGLLYVLAQLAFVGALVAVAAVAVVADGPELAHDLRETLLRLTPPRALMGAAVLALVVSAWSLGTGGRGVGLPQRVSGVRIPVVAVLGSIVVAASLMRLLLVRSTTAPGVLGDELIYSGLAKSIALDGLPRFRGELDLSHSLLYPLVLSPVYALAGDGARAYEVTKAIDAIIVTTAAVPTYLLARRVAGKGLALVVAALVAFEPWTAYASLVMTESLFLPAFTVFVLLLARMLERPSRGRQLAVLVGLMVLMGIRPQAYVLVAALAAGIGIRCIQVRPASETLRAYRLVLVTIAAGMALAVFALVAGAEIPGAGAGDVLKSLLHPVALVKWSLWNLAAYELTLGVAALAIFPLALHRMLSSPVERVRATGVALLTTSVAILLSLATVSASPFGLNVLHERYLFYVTPLVLVALAHWLQGSQPSRAAVWIAAIAAVALAATLPTDQIARANVVDGPTAAWVQNFRDTWRWSATPTKLVVVGLAAFGALVLVRSRSRVAPLLGVAVAFTALVCWLDYSAPISPDQDRRLAWVDHALPRGGRASLVHLGYSRSDQPCFDAADYEQQGLVVWTEFFNTRVDRVFHVLEQVERDNLDSPQLSVGPGGVVLLGGRPFAPRYAVLDSRQPVVGKPLARFDLPALGTSYQAGASLTLWDVDPPLRFLVHAQPLPPRADGREC